MPTEVQKERIIAEIDNALFLSKEEPDTIEHVDMSYSELMKLIKELAL